MIKALLRLVEWLDARFPSKVHVTEEAYDSLLGRLSKLELKAAQLLQSDDIRIARMTKMEVSIFAIKDFLAKSGANITKTESDKLREQFVKGEFRRDTTQEVIEAQG